MNAFRISGFWYLPGHEESQVPGELVYSPVEGATLILSGTFAEIGFDNTEYPRIEGLVADCKTGNFVILNECYRSGIAISAPGFPTERIRARHVFTSSHPVKDVELSFRGLLVRFRELASWSQGRGSLDCRFINEEQQAKGAEISYQLPEPITVHFEDVGVLRLASSFRTSESRPKTVVLEEQVWLSWDELGGLSLDQLHSDFLTPLHGFITFATDHANPIDELILKPGSAHANEGTLPQKLHLYFQPLVLSGSNANQYRVPSELLICFSDIGTSFSNTLTRWFELYRTCPTAMSGLLSSYLEQDVFVEDRFLKAVRVTLLYLSNVRGYGQDSEHTVSALIQSFAALVSEKLGPLAPRALPSVPLLGFSGALLKALHEHRSAMEPLIKEGFDKWVDKVLRSRSSVLGESELERLSGRELHRLSAQLMWLVKILLLEDLGFSKEHINKLVSRNRSYVFLKDST